VMNDDKETGMFRRKPPTAFQIARVKKGTLTC